MNKYFIFLYLIFVASKIYAQTLGGSSSYQFLRLTPSTQEAALGGINITNNTMDLSMAYNNPSLLSKEMHSQLSANFNNLYAGIKNYHLMMAYSHPEIATNFAIGLHYLNYGNTIQTDPSGNVMGSFNPRDFSLQLMASRQYLTRWTYGATLKFIHSNYGLVRSSAMAMDIAVAYADTTNFLQMSVVAKNMGVVLKPYNSDNLEELPFDLVVGISKKLDKAPVRFSLTAHHLHRFDILYNDTAFNNQVGAKNASPGKFTIEKLFQHIVFSTQLMIGKYLEVNAGYNFLRRSELRLYNVANGLVGFSMGAGVMFPKIQIRYARTFMQNSTGYNQLGVNLPLNKYFGLGKWGEQQGW
jgi:hypothetical protein